MDIKEEHGRYIIYGAKDSFGSLAEMVGYANKLAEFAMMEQYKNFYGFTAPTPIPEIIIKAFDERVD